MDPTNPLAIYIHWPFCSRICPYCDFNVHLDRRVDEADQLVEAIKTDLAYWRDWTGERTISSVHFGGGTPSLLSGAQLTALLEAVDALWGGGNAEIALEANPNDLTADRLSAWEAAGLTRLSLGVQSFDDTVLKRLGRDHDGAAATHALDAALDRFESVSVDLIFGVQGERDDRLARDLDHLLSKRVPHISTYQLTIEPGTAFAKAEARGQRLAVGEDRSASDFDLIRGRLTTEGYHHYEVSNFAKPGHESRHNLAYWRGWDYVGVGPGAHGRLWTDGVRTATETALKPTDYIAAAASRGTGMTEPEGLAPAQAAEEYVLMGLRIDEGVCLARLTEIRGAPLAIDRALITQGLLRVKGERLIATDEGRMVLDALTRALLV